MTITCGSCGAESTVEEPGTYSCHACGAEIRLDPPPPPAPAPKLETPRRKATHVCTRCEYPVEPVKSRGTIGASIMIAAIGAISTLIGLVLSALVAASVPIVGGAIMLCLSIMVEYLGSYDRKRCPVCSGAELIPVHAPRARRIIAGLRQSEDGTWHPREDLAPRE